MTLTITHAKTDNITDWTQADLDAEIAAGNYPVGTLLNDIVLPSDWNADHQLSGTLDVTQLPDNIPATKIADGSVSDTEFQYLDGATSNIQTQLNAKEPTLTKGNLTEATSSVLTITGGTGAVIGSGTSLQVKQANTTQSGYLSNTDWNTFNNKQGAITPAALTKTDDTNVTLTLGGTPETALLQATSLSLGWTGTLSPARGGTGVANNPAMTVTGSGNFAYTRTLTGATNVTFPTTGTLATLAGSEALTNKSVNAVTLTAAGSATQFLNGAGNYVTISGSSITGAALTKTDDTNVTITLGGSPATALLNASSLTMGWSGQLSIARGGTGAATQQAAINALAGGVTSGSYLRGNGTNITLSAIQASDVPTLTQYVPYTGATGPVALGNNALTIGTLSYSDTGILESLQSTTNSYNQLIIQNTNTGNAASTNIIVSNDQGTATTNFGEFGMNSSTFSGTGAFGAAGVVYLDATSRDLAIGTTTANAIHFVANGNATDAMTITSANAITLPQLTASTALALNASKNIVSVTNTGSGNNVLSDSPTLVTPALGTPTSGTLTSCTGLPIVGGTIGTLTVARGGTNLTALGTGNQMLGVNSGATAMEYKTMSVGTSGTDFAIANAANSMTFNLPDAGSGARGVVNTGSQTIAGAKTFTSAVTGNSFAATSSTRATNGLYLPSANTPGISANSLLVAQFSSVASAVNNWNFQNSATTNGVAAAAIGNDSNIAMQFVPKGTGECAFYANTGGSPMFRIQQSGTVANYFTSTSTATGTSPSLSVANGSDANINFTVVAKGTGVLQCAASNTNTVGVAANLNIDASGLIKKFSSSARYKKDIEDMREDAAEDILKLRPVWYRSKSDGDNANWSFYSFIAEDVAEIDARWALWDYLPKDRQYDDVGHMTIKEGAELVPDGISFPAIMTALVALVQKQEKRINELEKKCANY